MTRKKDILKLINKENQSNMIRIIELKKELLTILNNKENTLDWLDDFAAESMNLQENIICLISRRNLLGDEKKKWMLK